MLPLFWTLLNIGLIIFFLVICFRATKLIREKMGLFAAVIFVVGLLSASSSRVSNVRENKQTKTFGVDAGSNLLPAPHRVGRSTLDENWVNRIELMVETGTDSTSGQAVVISANTYLSGLISGYIWEPRLVSVKATKDHAIAYGVSGTIHWKLLGVTVYDESKYLSGTLETNSL
ncbi:hypothetical protein ACFQ4C_04305 [Larkinella insperata]|uniref:Uncharacterized protein n=1 Tax=Larkinella insperata TaxID=332158 RepID=A0ABW3Q3Q0_9BACT|nr:hypothetical protein [Larkinella insperata]